MNDLSKDAVNRLAVDEAGAGQRVDNVLLRVLKGVPKSHIYRILRSGEVRVNRLRVKPDVRLVLGDELRIPPIRTGLPATGKRKPPPLSASIPILYEDDALIAVDKPAGLAVHGGSGVAFGLIEQMRAARPTAKFLELVHRLDRDTSGVLLLAKKRAALVGLHAALREGRVDKRYQILVKGHWRDPKREVTLPLTKFLTSTGERRVRV
ncbi:MAG TPA: pseudouridine synthase, partial [Xanthomonadaceae bacterium]|nr:pseudouridine synthase [Xanthomonadaceae bacterium]